MLPTSHAAMADNVNNSGGGGGGGGSEFHELTPGGSLSDIAEEGRFTSLLGLNSPTLEERGGSDAQLRVAQVSFQAPTTLPGGTGVLFKPGGGGSREIGIATDALNVCHEGYTLNRKDHLCGGVGITAACTHSGSSGSRDGELSGDSIPRPVVDKEVPRRTSADSTRQPFTSQTSRSHRPVGNYSPGARASERSPAAESIPKPPPRSFQPSINTRRFPRREALHEELVIEDLGGPDDNQEVFIPQVRSVLRVSEGAAEHSHALKSSERKERRASTGGAFISPINCDPRSPTSPHILSQPDSVYLKKEFGQAILCPVCQGEVVCKPNQKVNSHQPVGTSDGNIISLIDPSVVGPAVAWRSGMFSRYRSCSMPEHTFRKHDLGLIRASEEGLELEQEQINHQEQLGSLDFRQCGDSVDGADGDWDTSDSGDQFPKRRETGSIALGPSKRSMVPGSSGALLQGRRRRSADSSLLSVNNRALPTLPVSPCKCRTISGQRDLNSSNNSLSPSSSCEIGFPPIISSGHYTRRRELVRLSPIQGAGKRALSNSNGDSPPSAESSFRPISPSSNPCPTVKSLPVPQASFARSPSPTLSARSLSPIPYIRQRANTFSGSGLFSNERPSFLSPPRSPARLPRDPIQPSKGSISDLSDKHTQDELGEESDSFSLHPLPRQRSMTCPENRAWRRRKVAANNRPPTPPPSLAVGGSPRGSNVDITGRRLAGLTLSPGMARRSDLLQDLPQLLEDQDQDVEIIDREKLLPNKLDDLGTVPISELKIQDRKPLRNENSIDPDFTKLNKLGVVR